MVWNHRVIRHKDDKGNVWYQIHEVYYDEKDGKYHPTSVTVDSIAPYGEDVEELRSTLEMMIKCLGDPVLDYDGDFPDEKGER